MFGLQEMVAWVHCTGVLPRKAQDRAAEVPLTAA